MADPLVTTVVEFGGAAGSAPDYLFYVVRDTDEELVNGDHCKFVVNHSSNVVINRVLSTAGDMVSSGSGSRSSEELVLFSANDSANPTVFSPIVVPSSVGIKYYGNVGLITKKSLGHGMVEYLGDVTKVPFIGKLTVNYNCVFYDLIPPSNITYDTDSNGDEFFPIGVVFYITVT